MKNTAIVLAGGSGKRMGTAVKKQYLELKGRPVLAYSLCLFEKSPLIREIILVTSKEEMAYCREHILAKYGISKAVKIVEGGKERKDSVYAGLKACEDSDYVFIHDGARPFVDDAMLERLLRDAGAYGASIAAMPVKDTIKIADAGQNIIDTPDRTCLWQAQTPQVFSYPLILSAYRKALKEQAAHLTDDASCVEYAGLGKVHLTPGSYENIKITTKEDLLLAEAICEKYVK